MRTNKNGRVILKRCEVCGNDLTKEEQETRGHECNACVEDIKETFRRIDARYNFSRDKETGKLIITDKETGELFTTEKKPAK
jgi:uncharacterized FlaG/YvyC family protein